MKAERILSAAFVDEHPDEVAALLEPAEPKDAVKLLAACAVEPAAAVLARMEPLAGAECLTGWPAESVAALLAALPAESATRLLRAVDEPERRRLLDLAGPEVAETLERALHYPAGTAGALMDPSVFTLPDQIDAGEAQRRIRRSAPRVRNYVFVVDRSQTLRGVLNLRDLMLAPEKQALAEIVRPVEERLSAAAPMETVALHPGWRRFEVLPVVDRENRIVGVLRRAALSPPAGASATSPVGGPGAVGVGVAHLFWTVGATLLDPLFSAVSTTPTAPKAGEEP